MASGTPAEVSEITVVPCWAATGRALEALRVPRACTVLALRWAVAAHCGVDLPELTLLVEGKLLDRDSMAVADLAHGESLAVGMVRNPIDETVPDWGMHRGGEEEPLLFSEGSLSREAEFFPVFPTSVLLSCTRWRERWAQCFREVSDLPSYGSGRRALGFALEAAEERQRRLEKMMVDAPGICVGSVPKRDGQRADARYTGTWCFA